MHTIIEPTAKLLTHFVPEVMMPFINVERPAFKALMKIVLSK